MRVWVYLAGVQVYPPKPHRFEADTSTTLGMIVFALLGLLLILYVWRISRISSARVPHPRDRAESDPAPGGRAAAPRSRWTCESPNESHAVYCWICGFDPVTGKKRLLKPEVPFVWPSLSFRTNSILCAGGGGIIALVGFFLSRNSYDLETAGSRVVWLGVATMGFSMLAPIVYPFISYLFRLGSKHARKPKTEERRD